MNQSEALDDVTSNKDEISGAVELHCLVPQLVESWDPPQKKRKEKEANENVFKTKRDTKEMQIASDTLR